MRRWLIPLLLVLAGAMPLAAQNLGRVQSPVLTIESERLFADSNFGQAFAEEIEADSAALAAENRRIEAELIAEEQDLTEQRKNLEPEAFRELADAFDAKVQRIRQEQDQKARQLGSRSEETRRQFLIAAQPVLEAIMRDAGAAVIVERGSVFMSADVIDVTDRAIAEMNARTTQAEQQVAPQDGSVPDGPTQDQDTPTQQD